VTVERLRPSLQVLSVAPALLLLVSCADAGLSALEAYAENVNARPPSPIEPIPEIPPVHAFPYVPGERRDPFVMDPSTAGDAQRRDPGALAPDPSRRKEPLEAYSLDSLSMVGTLEQYQTRWALLRTPDGMLHRVRVGDYIGRNNGRIVQIGPNALRLTELVEEEPGLWQQRQASMALKQ
jgi:type IV pilus assembly protein PilP